MSHAVSRNTEYKPRGRGEFSNFNLSLDLCHGLIKLSIDCVCLRSIQNQYKCLKHVYIADIHAGQILNSFLAVTFVRYCWIDWYPRIVYIAYNSISICAVLYCIYCLPLPLYSILKRTRDVLLYTKKETSRDLFYDKICDGFIV